MAPIVLPTLADLAEKVSPAVVSVRVRPGTARAGAASAQNGAGPGPIPPQSGRDGTALGSGFFISGDGYVVTNNHVVENASAYTVILDDGTEYPAKLIGRDERTDLAVLKVDAGSTFTYVKWADDPPRLGDWVVAIGNPFGFGGTVTMGIVSARVRTLNSSVYEDYFQIDAPINRGNSGGPTFNLKGEVIGINTAIYSPSGDSVGIAFAIPAASASKIVATLRDKGAIVRGWIGVQTQPVTSTIAASLKLPDTKGAMVANPLPGGPAEVAGIRAGDVILSVEGKRIADARDLTLTIAANAPDTMVRVTVWRDGATKDVPVQLGALQDPVPGGRTAGGNGGNNPVPPVEGSPQDSILLPGLGLFPTLGLSLAPAKDRANGLAIVNVLPNGPADKVGLSEGDMVIAVGGSPVSNPAEVAAALQTARNRGTKVIMVQIQSGTIRVFVGIPIS